MMALPSKYDQVAEKLMKEIGGGHFSAGDKLPGVGELARTYRTTIATMSKALDLLDRQGLILRHAGKGIYVKERPPFRAAVVFDNPEDQLDFTFSAVFCRLARNRFREENIAWSEFFNVANADTAEIFRLQLRQQRFDMVLVCSAYVARNHRKIFRDSKALLIGLYDYKELDNTITFNTASLVEDAVETLHRCGAREIVMIGNDYPESWRKHLNAAGKGFDLGFRAIRQSARPEQTLCRELSMQGGFIAGLELIKKFSERPLGIICCDSLMTLGLFQSIISAQLRVPEDVIIATHMNSQSPINTPLLPVICYITPVENMLDRILGDFRQFSEDRNLVFGDRMLPHVKSSESLDEYLKKHNVNHKENPKTGV